VFCVCKTLNTGFFLWCVVFRNGFFFDPYPPSVCVDDAGAAVVVVVERNNARDGYTAPDPTAAAAAPDRGADHHNTPCRVLRLPWPSSNHRTDILTHSVAHRGLIGPATYTSLRVPPRYTPVATVSDKGARPPSPASASPTSPHHRTTVRHDAVVVLRISFR